MNKMMKNRDILGLGSFFMSSWDTVMADAKLGSRTLYNLIRLKKTVLPIAENVQETVIEIAKSHGGETLDNGGIKVPDDKIQEVNKIIEEFLEEEESIESPVLKVTDDDSMPSALMDAIFDFIEFED